MSYKVWATVLAFASFTLANMGLNQILSISVPILNAIYPVAIMLIVLAMMNRFINESRLVYSVTILVTGVISVVDALNQVNIRLGALTTWCEYLPLYKQGLGWVTLALGAIVVTVVMDKVFQLSTSNQTTTVNCGEE